MTTVTPLPELTGSYVIDPIHSRIGFVARHAMVTKVRGSFNDFEGTVELDGENPGKSAVNLTIKAASIDTRNAGRDGHLRSGEFLDLENHPTITFVSTGAERPDDRTVQLTGDLTIRGVTRSITIDFDFEGSAKDTYGNQRLGFEGSVDINRKDYGITWNAALETGGVLISDKIVLEFEVSLVKQG